MTSQPRGIPTPGYQPSQSQPIPSRYNQPPFVAGQAFSPRPVSSSPLQHQAYYPQQAGISGPPHDMYKTGPGVAGTPPTQTMMMPQQAFYNGHRSRPPMQPMQNAPRGQYFYPHMPRYPSMPGPPTSPSYFPPGQPQQYQYHMQPAQMASQQPQMFPQGYASQYGQPSPQQPQMQPVQPAMSHVAPSSTGKREKRIIRIVDPNTNQDITADIVNVQKSDSLSTPPSGRSSATPPTTDVAAKFAAQVALVAGTTKSASPLTTPPMVDSSPIPINQNFPVMPQEQQIVGSPSMTAPGYMVQPASSPRPQVLQQQYMHQMPPGHAGPPQMIHPSPSHVATPPLVQHGQMGAGPPMQEQIQHTAPYQLPPQPQQFGTSPMHTSGIRPPTPNIPEHVHTYPVRSQPVNVTTGAPAILSQVQTVRPPSQPPVGDAVQNNPPAVVQTQIPQQKDVLQDKESEEKTPKTVASPEQEEAGNEAATSNAVESVTAANTDLPTETEKKEESPSVIPKPVEAAQVVAPVETTTEVEKPDKTEEPVKQVPSAPEEREQAPEKEDTAIRLEEKSDAKTVEKVEKSETIEPVPPTDKAESNTQSETPSVTTKSEIPPSEGPPTEDPKKEPTTLVPEEAKPQVKVTPPTPQTKSASSKLEEEKASAPSAKAVVTKPEQKPDVPPVQTEKSAKPVVDKQPNVKSPESQQKPAAVDTQQGKSDRKDSSSSDSVKQSKSLPAKQGSQKPTEKPVVNGLLSDASAEPDTSGKGTKKAEDMQPSPKASKAQETNSAESKPKPKETSRNRSVSSDKSSEKQPAEKANGVTPDKSKPGKGEIKYESDQWSPLNPEGKRQYDSMFLLQFQYRATSLEKPKDLPNIDCVLEQPHKQIAAPMQPMEYRGGGGSDFIPNFMMRGPGPRRPGRQNSRDHRSGRSSVSGPSGPKKVVSIDRDVELKTTANAWKPIRRDQNLKMAPEELETLEVIRDVRAILNKLTPSTFKELMQQVLALKIDTEKKLRGTIDLIFEKAIDEPNFSEAYANMCRQMTSIRVTPEVLPGAEQPAPGQTVEFRKLLLTRCQREFEKNKSDQEHLLELKKKMEANTDAEIAPQLKEEYEIAESKERRRTLGNIRFIGELFKLRMLTESIMHNCIMSLFRAKDDDHLESLCRLLMTIGKDLDHPKGKQRMDQYFEQIMKIIQEKRTSPRVRFMLQDVQDLRSNNWVPRAIQTQGPKTITQIHQDAKNEEQMLQLRLATTATPTPTKQGNRQQNRMGSRGHVEDGWTKVAQPAKPSRYDPTKMKLKPSQLDSTNVTLGPSREFGKWKSGSAGSGITRTGSSGYSPSGSMDRTPESGRSNTPTSMMNRFSALSQGNHGSDYDYQRRQGGRQSSREGSRTGSRGSMGPPSASSSGGRTPRKDERSSVLEAARQLTSDRGYDSRTRSSRESSPSVAPRPSTPQQQPAARKYTSDLNEEKMKQKSKGILEEFLSILDFKEATECVEELNAPPELMHIFVNVVHEFTLEKKKEERINAGRLMAHLLKRGRLSIEQYVKGLADLLEMATENEIDIPKIWEYFAEQLVPVFEDEKQSDVPLSYLAKLAAPLQEEGKSGVFTAEVVKAIIRRGTLEGFIARWQRSNLLWSKIIGEDDDTVEKFLEKHNLQDLSDSEGPPRQAQSDTPTRPTQPDERYRLEKELTKLIVDKASNEDIFVWVDKNVKKEDTVKKPFLRALTLSICRNSYDEEKMSVVEERISDRSIVLKKYIETNPERELQVLYALQELMVVLEQPANVLRKFFDVLYNEDVVSEQTFYKWEKSDDPNEQEGRGVAVASVNPFFTWLRTAEPESD